MNADATEERDDVTRQRRWQRKQRAALRCQQCTAPSPDCVICDACQETVRLAHGWVKRTRSKRVRERERREGLPG